MKLTGRDASLVRDLALSHVLARDQIIACGYFTSVTRANTRLRGLAEIGLVRRIKTPYFGQGLYSVGCRAREVLGPRIAGLVSNRKESPRFLQHALATTDVRIALSRRGSKGWRFEQQLWTSFWFAGREHEVRPDGLAIFENGFTVVEVDMGHVAPSKIRTKLESYNAFLKSGECERHWAVDWFRLFLVTTGQVRAGNLLNLLPDDPQFELRCVPFEALDISPPGAWS